MGDFRDAHDFMCFPTTMVAPFLPQGEFGGTPYLIIKRDAERDGDVLIYLSIAENFGDAHDLMRFLLGALGSGLEQ